MNDSAVIGADCSRRLLALRAFTGETQKQLAMRVGMTDSMISRLERGTHVPSLATLCRIANAFGRRLEIVFHERQLHPHSHGDAEHRYDHEGANRARIGVVSAGDAQRKQKCTPVKTKTGMPAFKSEERVNWSKRSRARLANLKP